MPKVRPLTEAQRLKLAEEKEQEALARDRKAFVKALQIAMIESGTDRKTVCKKAGIKQTTWYQRLQAPDSLTLGQLRSISKVIAISPEAVLAMAGIGA